MFAKHLISLSLSIILLLQVFFFRLCGRVLTKPTQQLSVFCAEADSEPTDTFLVDSNIWGDLTPGL